MNKQLQLTNLWATIGGSTRGGVLPNAARGQKLKTHVSFLTAALGGPPTIPRGATGIKPPSDSREGGARTAASLGSVPTEVLKNVLWGLSLSLFLEAANSRTPPPPDFTNTQNVIYPSSKNGSTSCMFNLLHIF